MSTPTIPSHVREAAAVWRARRDAGLADLEAAELAAWLNADRRHAIAYHEIDVTWDALALLRDEHTAGEPDPDLLSPAEVLEFPAQSGGGHKPAWRRPAVIITAVATAVLAVLLWSMPAIGPAPAATVPVVRMIDLPDGSVVQLNSDSAVELDNYSASVRKVRLTRGEAHFVVAPDPDRPFLVTVRDVTVRAVGTAFNIRLVSSSVEVLVTEGKVKLENTATGGTLLRSDELAGAAHRSPDPLLRAGQRAVIPMDAVAAKPVQVEALAAPEMARELAWRNPTLEFTDVTLAEAVAEFNRHNRHQLRIVDPAIGLWRFGGTFRPDAYEAFVRLLESDFGVTAERYPNETRLRRSR